jgi:hypothetical protein
MSLSTKNHHQIHPPKKTKKATTHLKSRPMRLKGSRDDLTTSTKFPSTCRVRGWILAAHDGVRVIDCYRRQSRCYCCYLCCYQ